MHIRAYSISPWPRINLGLALQKPGESDLGVAMRLWYANRASWSFTNQSWEKRLRNTQPEEDSTKKPTLIFPNCVEKLHNDFLESDSKFKLRVDDLGFLGTAKERRQCTSCARAGYHCKLFDYPWLDECPVHEEPLVNRCPNCSRFWPTSSNVNERTCRLCGIRSSIEELIDHGAFDTTRYKARLEKLLSFFCYEQAVVSSWRRDVFHLSLPHYTKPARIHSYPSILLKQRGLRNSERDELVSLGLHFIPCHRKSVVLSPFELADRMLDFRVCQPKELALMRQCRSRIINLTLRVLARHSPHELGGCLKDKYLGYYNCVICEAWRQIRKGLNTELPSRSDMTVLSYHPPKAHRININNPGLVTSIYVLDENKSFYIDSDTTALIYQVELWLCIRKMMTHINRNLGEDFDPRESTVSSNHPDRHYLSDTDHHFGYFHFTYDHGKCELIFPKAYVSRDFNDLQTLPLLFRRHFGTN